jgi:hypothetical protein
LIKFRSITDEKGNKRGRRKENGKRDGINEEKKGKEGRKGEIK